MLVGERGRSPARSDSSSGGWHTHVYVCAGAIHTYDTCILPGCQLYGRYGTKREAHAEGDDVLRLVKDSSLVVFSGGHP